MANQKSSPTPEEQAYFEKTVYNARRLSTDSRLLIENDRPHSAIMIAILAIEEFGKALITAWGVKNKANNRSYPTHIEKQSATFALLAANEAISMKKKKLRKILLEHGGNFHNIGPLSSQFAFARSGFFDDLRMAVTYVDQSPKLKFEENNVTIEVSLASELLGWLDMAAIAIANASAMDLASTFFEHDLGRM